MRRAPRALVVAIVVIALGIVFGIGVSAGVFSVADGMPLRPLPFPAPYELVLRSSPAAASGAPLVLRTA